MNKEEFEKYFGEISHLFDTWFNIDYNEQRKEMKKILEEIYNKGYEDGFGYLIDGKEAKP